MIVPMETDPIPSKPLLIYDGDCAFCRNCVEYGRRLTGDAVAYAPYQQVGARFPQVSTEQFRAAAQFVECGGKISSGAEAVFRALSYAPRCRWLLRLYTRSRSFAAVSERVYAWVARHRDGLYRLMP